MEYFLSFGLVMGLTAGLSPGPLLTLVMTETLQHGIKSGVKVALAPIISDAPIVILMLLIVDQLASFDHIAGVLSLLGGSYVLYMAYDSARVKLPTSQHAAEKSKSITKGVLANVLNPHPYLFWLAVGAPTIIQSFSVSSLAPVAFIAGFYIPLVGSKIGLAILIGKYRALLSTKSYTNIMKVLAVLLGIFAVILLLEGLKLLGIYEFA